jgi:hypothetical protein
MGPGSHGVGPAALLPRAALLAIALLPALTSTAIAADELSPQTFEADIAALEKDDPGTPEALIDRIENAQYLVDAKDADCHQRLDTAQSQLDTVARAPATDIALPSGRARIADIRYRLKLARSSCGVAPAERESDLREALAAAQQAVGLYRDALDYQSMAIMQFNVGATQRTLGDHEAAFASLEAAVAIDREYGFHEDEADNDKLLALWGAPEKAVQRGVAQAAAEPATVPGPVVTDPVVTVTGAAPHAVSLKFAWSANDATVTTRIDRVGFMGDSLIQGSASRTFRQHVRAHGNGWTVSYEAGQIAYDVPAGQGEPREDFGLAQSLGQALLLPGFEVDVKGDFKQSAALRRVELNAAAGAIEDHAAEDYDFKTGIWIGATLEQGVWYNMSGQMILPGTRRLLFPHDVEFAYTRDVPCTPAATSPSCIEIVVHATPQEKPLAEMLNYANRALTFHHRVRCHYWSTTYIRIVTDPGTLTTYAYDVRRYWHASGDTLESDRPQNHFARLVSTFTYP